MLIHFLYFSLQNISIFNIILKKKHLIYSPSFKRLLVYLSFNKLIKVYI